MKEFILPWVMILTYGGDSRAIDHVEFESLKMCEAAKVVIANDYQGSWSASSPRMFCVQRSTLDTSAMKPER